MPNELAAPSDRQNIRQSLESMKEQFKLALPRLLTADRFVRVALTCINKNPKLLQCTRDSLLACLLDCAQLGIEPDGRRAHLIPYGDKCTLIIDYKGIAELVRRSGEVSTLHAGIVYPGDEFDYAFGTGQFLKHRPSLERNGDEKPQCVYSYVRLKDGQEDFDVMGIAEVEKVRKRSRAGNNGPWVTDFDEMAKKTVFRRHSKWLPLSPELREKIEKDDDPLTEQERFAAAKEIKASSEISFGPAGVSPQEPGAEAAQEPQNRGEPPSNLVLEPKENFAPKRKRRTKAEMEAARAGQQHSNEGGSGDSQEKAGGSTAKETTPAPPLATPMQGIENLIAASPITKEQLVRHLIQNRHMEPSQKLEDLSDEKLIEIQQSFMSIASELVDKPNDKPPFE